MFVKYWMTESPKSAAENTDLAEALQLMLSNKIRRLPVVRGRKVCGMLTLSDLYQYVGPHALAQPQIPEAALEKLRMHKVAEAMTVNPYVCDPTVTLEDVGDVMRKEKIGALPVVEQDHLVGLITESDIMSALIRIARLDGSGSRICFKIPAKDKSQILYKVMDVCIMNDLDILTVLTHAIGDDTQLVMMRIKGQHIETLVKELRDNKYELLLVGESTVPIRRVDDR